MHASPLPDLLAGELPLVGRAAELERLRGLVGPSGPPLVLLRGPGGVGKSRLAQVAAASAERAGDVVLHGRAYPVEEGVPYALFADAFLPYFREVGESALDVVSRGGYPELIHLFPALAHGEDAAVEEWGDPGELRSRLFWNLTSVLHGLAERSPLLVVLDDLHWADRSSLELLHFLVRQCEGHPLRFLCTSNVEYRDVRPDLVDTLGSLRALGTVEEVEVAPLPLEAVGELVDAIFGVDPAATREFSALLYGWTRGNPFFAAETLKALVRDGVLHRREGSWLGWETREMRLPTTIRDTIAGRVRALSPQARELARAAAVVGNRVPHPLLRAVLPDDGESLLDAIEEVVTAGVLEEAVDGGRVVYDFRHPLFRETLYQEAGLARTRLLHRRVAEAIEAIHGDDAIEHADALAYHFTRASDAELAGKTVRYLRRAGRGALARHANREAADYLAVALDLLEGSGGRIPEERVEEWLGVAEDLARAHQRLGEFGRAEALWERIRERAEAAGDAEAGAAAERRLALCGYFAGRHGRALAHFDRGLELVPPGAGVLRSTLLLGKGVCLQESGRPDEARTAIEAGLDVAAAEGDPALLARMHRAMALLHAWTGPPERSREHGRRAVELAREAEDVEIRFWGHWILAVVEGITGDTPRMTDEMEAAKAAADELRSPILEGWTAEIEVERAHALGEWDQGIAIGERAIARARSLNQATLLPRLLVWTAFIHLGRGDLERGGDLVEEAWRVAEPERGEGERPDVHTAVPAYIGRAAFHLRSGEYEEAVRVGSEGLALADRCGYPIWAIHRLLPTIAEARLYSGDVEGARRVGERLRADSERFDHTLGIAWADACDALVSWLSGDVEGGARLLRGAAEALERIPVVPDAARIRRQLAGRLAELGRRDEALEELRRCHETFVDLGAGGEIEKTRGMFREIDARPPPRSTGEGVGALTGREMEVASLVAERKSNKAIGKELGISSRTVSTHLSNVYGKLGVGSRGELTDLVREGRIPTG